MFRTIHPNDYTLYKQCITIPQVRSTKFNLQFLYISAIEEPQLKAKFIILKRLWPLTEVKRSAACTYTPSSSVNLSSYFISPKQKYFRLSINLAVLCYKSIYILHTLKGVSCHLNFEKKWCSQLTCYCRVWIEGCQFGIRGIGHVEWPIKLYRSYTRWGSYSHNSIVNNRATKVTCQIGQKSFTIHFLLKIGIFV